MPRVLTITLNDGNTIPQLGFGIIQIAPKVTVKVVSEALAVFAHSRQLTLEIRGYSTASGLNRLDGYTNGEVATEGFS